MKLFMIIYLAGNMVGTIGPLPYDMDECLHRAEKLWKSGDHGAVTKQGFTTRDVRFACEYHNERPTLKDPTE